MGIIIFPMARQVLTVPVPAYGYLCNPQGITARARRSPKLLDTLWVTRRLLADRDTLGIVPSADDYVYFLQQTLNNHKRIYRSRGPRVARLAFDEHRRLHRRHFAGMDSDHPFYGLVALTLGRGHYRLYRLLCGLG